MDRINTSSSFPINHAISAYAQNPKANRPGGSPFVQSVQPLRPTAAPESIQSTQSINPTQRPTRADTIGKIAPKPGVLQSSSVDQLIGAKVQPIDLNRDIAKITGPKPVATSAGTYTMYPQAADRNQAATGVYANRGASTSLGRSLDLRG